MRRSIHLHHEQVQSLLQDAHPIAATDSKQTHSESPTNVPASIPSIVVKPRSRVVHLLWLCFIAFALAVLGAKFVQQDVIEGVLTRVGSHSSDLPLTSNATRPLETTDPQWDAENFLQGPPAESFRSNLKYDQKYITGWTFAGWSEDFVAFANLVYLGIISGRIPVIPPFPPSSTHLGTGGKYLTFGEIFDLPRLRASLRMPIVEWKDIKEEGTPVIDTLGCWSPWAAAGPEKKPMENALLRHLNLDVSYTSTPLMRLTSNEGDGHVPFWGLSSLTFPKGRDQAITSPAAVAFSSPLRKITLPPDAQLACFDTLYHVGAHASSEWAEAYSPAWRFVGTHIHWNPTLRSLAEGYLRHTFGLDDGEAIPPFIAVHIRRGDFAQRCSDSVPGECLPALDDYAAEVEKMQDQLLIQRGTRTQHIFVASDEHDAAWWDGVRAKGWSFIDHSSVGTAARHGKWYPLLIDAVLLSASSGFVGTHHSTLSLVSGRRVEDWNGGFSSMAST